MINIQEKKLADKIILSRKADLRYELDTILDKLKKEIKAKIQVY